MFSIKANFEKENLWKSSYLRLPGSLKPSSSIHYILFSSEGKYCWAQGVKLRLIQAQMRLIFSLWRPIAKLVTRISNHTLTRDLVIVEDL